MAEKLTQAETPIIVVDHHHPHPDTVKIASQLVVDESAAAAAEVVYNLWQVSNVEVGAQEARSLLAAIFIETKHFLLATESTFEIAAGLVKAGADPRHLSELMSNPVSRSEGCWKIPGRLARGMDCCYLRTRLLPVIGRQSPAYARGACRLCGR